MWSSPASSRGGRASSLAAVVLLVAVALAEPTRIDERVDELEDDALVGRGEVLNRPEALPEASGPG